MFMGLYVSTHRAPRVHGLRPRVSNLNSSVLGMRKRVMWCVRERPKLYPLKKKKRKPFSR